MIIELPVVYLKNAEEVEASERMGLSCKPEEEITKTTFFFNEFSFLRVNPSSEKNRTILYFSADETYMIDADYETVIGLIKEKI